MYSFKNITAKAICGVFAVLMSIFSFAQPSVAVANTTICQTITSLPTVINRPGVYCLKRDLIYRATTGAALEVRSNNVVVDLNGFRIYGTPALGNETVGVKVSNKQKVKITNGTIERFRVGIELDRGIVNSVVNVHLDQNRQFGILQGGAGKSLSIVENTVSRTGGSTSPIRPGVLTIDISSAMLIGDTNPGVFGAHVVRNTVFDVRSVVASTTILGITSFASNGNFKYNTVSGRALGVGLGVGGDNANIAENSVVNETNIGNGYSAGPTSIRTNNTAINFAINFSGLAFDGGGNISVP